MHNKFIIISEMHPIFDEVIDLCKFFAELFGQKKNNPYLCSIACEPLGVKRAVLFYEKDVFERLSL